jgi:hypothetical protein
LVCTEPAKNLRKSLETRRPEICLQLGYAPQCPPSPIDPSDTPRTPLRLDVEARLGFPAALTEAQRNLDSPRWRAESFTPASAKRREQQDDAQP